MKYTLPLLALILEGFLLFSIGDLLGPGIPFFFTMVLVIVNYTFSIIPKYRQALCLILLGLIVASVATCKVIFIYVERDVRDVVAQIKELKGPVSIESIHPIVDKQNWLGPRIRDIHIEENHSYTIFYYIIQPAISHWYNSLDGFGHSDD